jgi:predicted Rossmann fold nucleotide-binding protein DprA/Smf involved in DNA uptake
VLLAVPGLGPVTFAALLAAFGSARATLAAAAGPNGVAELREAMADRTDGGGSAEVPADFEARTGPPLGADLASRIRHQIADADRALAVVRSLGLTVVTLDDQEYPERLRRIDMPPPLLFVRGSLAALTSPAAVAVVGTRRPTDKGRLIAAWIGSALAGLEPSSFRDWQSASTAPPTPPSCRRACPRSRFSAAATLASSPRLTSD